MPRGLMQRGEFALAGEASMPYGLMQPWLSLWGKHQPRLLPLRFLRGRRSEILNLAFPLKRSASVASSGGWAGSTCMAWVSASSIAAAWQQEALKSATAT